MPFWGMTKWPPIGGWLLIRVAAHSRFYCTVGLVILACLFFCEYLILGLSTKFRIHKFSFFFSSSIIKIIFAIFLNSRICPPREIRENSNITRSTVYNTDSEKVP